MYAVPVNHTIWWRQYSDIENSQLYGSREEGSETVRPEFSGSIMIDFQGAKITSYTGFLLLLEIDNRFGVAAPVARTLEDRRPPLNSKHPLVQMIRQRIYQTAADYEDCNDADFLRINPAVRLAIGKGPNAGAGQSVLSRLENDVLGT